MQQADIRKQWEGAASGWAPWEAAIATWMEPATEAMLAMAGVATGARVLDLACGAGSQTLRAAQSVGAQEHVVASDIADTMLHHVRENARVAGLAQGTPLAGAACPAPQWEGRRGGLHHACRQSIDGAPHADFAPETPTGFVAAAEVLVAAGAKSA